MSITRYQLMMYLKTISALHSGGVEETVNREDPETKQERKATAQRFARDGQGQPYLPGRSIKGAIRAACEQTVARADGAIDEDGLLTKDSLKALWGGETAASVLTVHPIVLPVVEEAAEKQGENEGEDGARAVLRERPGIAIDRYWGAVGDGALFVHEVLPAGAELKLRISAHVDTESGRTPEQVEALLRLIVELFKAEQIAFGKRKGAGWGGVTLAQDLPEKSVFLTRTKLDTPDGLVSWLSGGEKLPLEELPAIESVSDAQERLTIRVEWSSPTGILVADVERYEHELKKKKECEESRKKTGEPEECPPVSLRQLSEPSKDPKNKLVIPGSSIRGALRNRATRIARTILFATEGAGGEYTSDWSDEDVHKQLAADVPLIHDLFGTTDRRGALTVREVRSRTLGEKITVTHNAGDRWTGGVIDGGLYSEEYYVDMDWQDIRLEIDPAYLYRPKDGQGVSDEYARGRRLSSLVLLGLVVAEFATGTLPIGSRGTRGMGAVEVKTVEVSGPKELLGTSRWELEGGGQAIARELLKKLREMNEGINGNWTDYLTKEPEAAPSASGEGLEEQL
ncbi:RAMP superfamily CRISPR-associated protein [Schaalia sp. Marseille-Q2122]|uniref:RAMP superfamily CRISPR-associated protein n=1 Tax=Schaalia sp. Marseille-Q2122 TaxID=2736604 RepID=UPI00158E982F|nr:RAMP superfamily CRISPR-associated protein [Schaalia sp. Marseille-Q2122]